MWPCSFTPNQIAMLRALIQPFNSSRLEDILKFLANYRIFKFPLSFLGAI